MFNAWFFYLVAQILTFFIVKPFVGRDMRESIKNSRLSTMYHVFYMRHKYLSFLNNEFVSIDADSTALNELISLYEPKLDLSENATDEEIENLRYHSKNLFTSLFPSQSSSCIIEHHPFEYNSNKLAMYYIQHGKIDNWQDSNQSIILYFHGGGFVYGDIDTYGNYECHLSRYHNMLVLHVELRHSPEYLLEDIIHDVIDVYQYLLNIDPNINKRLIGMGDSSGGMLWIYLLQWIVANNKPIPQGIVLHSPWPHLDFAEDTFRNYVDHILSVKLVFNLRQVLLENRFWFELTDDEINKISPKENEVKGFPPIYITAGTHEIFIDEIRRLAKKIGLSGTEVVLNEGQGLMHNYALFDLWTLKGKCVQKNVHKWIQTQLFLNTKSEPNDSEALGELNICV